METFEGKPVVYAKNRAAWRSWLKKNSNKQLPVWLVLYHNASTVPSVSYTEAVEEGLCFGYIDSLKKKRDHESSYQTFSPRKDKSNWSKSNRDRVNKLIAAGLMTEQGQRLIDIAKSTGNWDNE